MDNADVAGPLCLGVPLLLGKVDLHLLEQRRLSRLAYATLNPSDISNIGKDVRVAQLQNGSKWLQWRNMRRLTGAKQEQLGDLVVGLFRLPHHSIDLLGPDVLFRLRSARPHLVALRFVVDFTQDYRLCFTSRVLIFGKSSNSNTVYILYFISPLWYRLRVD